MSDLEERLAKARAARAEIAARREKRAAERADREAVEAEERAVEDELAIDAAEEKYGTLGKDFDVEHTDLGVLIVRRPAAPTFRKFQDVGKFTSDALDKFVKPCRVHPDAETFDKILEKYPAKLATLANKCAALAGARSEDVAGKL